MLIAAVGDVMLGESALQLGGGVRSICARHGVDFPFARVATVLRSADLAFCNLECVLSDCELDPNSVRSLSMRGSPESVAGLRNAGFRVVSLANNHAMDQGQSVLADTVSRLLQWGIRPVGSVSDGPGARQPAVLSVDGFSVAFLAHSLVGIAPGRDGHSTMAGLLNGVTEARSACDALVVSLHWGDEYMTIPATWQIELGRRIIDAGASLVLGHHPHVLQPVEKYRRGLIAYSLGNFVCDMRWGITRRSAVLLVEIEDDGVGAFQTIPVEVNRRWQPVVNAENPHCHSVQKRLPGRSQDDALWLCPHGSWSGRYRLARAIVRGGYRINMAMEVFAALARYPLRWKLQVLRQILRVGRGTDGGGCVVSSVGWLDECRSKRRSGGGGRCACRAKDAT